MSLLLDFTVHSWYMGAAIRQSPPDNWLGAKWVAYIENGNTYNVDNVYGATLKAVKQAIKQYWQAEHDRDAMNRRMIGEK